MIKKPRTKTLDEQFEFSQNPAARSSHRAHGTLWSVTGIEDGETYSLRLYRKVGTDIDADLRRLLTSSLRKMRRVLASLNARENLVEALELVEDENEIGVLLADAGQPITHLPPSRLSNLKSRFFTNVGRALFWRNLIRVAEGLSCCHNAGIIHGNVRADSIFTFQGQEPDFRLGGYEACIHVASRETTVSKKVFGISRTVSFQKDWMDLGDTAQTLLGVNSENSPTLSMAEERLLNRLARPPRFERFDGLMITQEIKNVVSELERIGSSSQGELILYPSKKVQAESFADLSRGAISAEDTEALLSFVQDDLSGEHVRVEKRKPETDYVRIITDRAFYKVKLVDNQVGMIVRCDRRTDREGSLRTVDLIHVIRLTKNRREANERCRARGNGALSWNLVGQSVETTEQEELPVWYALILLEAFTLLREQFQIYPVETVTLGPDDEPGIIGLVPCTDHERDQRRQSFDLPPVAEAMNRHLQYDEGLPDWTLMQHDRLSRSQMRLPELAYYETRNINGRVVHVFVSSENISVDRKFFLRPKPDTGSERAIRRRLHNIVAAKNNTTLLRALDDPATVAADELLKNVAPPGTATPELDASKETAWNMIKEGRSLNVVVGPPGVGKTFLISQLIKSVLDLTPDARILVSAQSHETLANLETELKNTLLPAGKIVARVEKSKRERSKSALRNLSTSLLKDLLENSTDELAATQYHRITHALEDTPAVDTSLREKTLRDTESLLLRAADVTLATTNSMAIEEMIKDGDQFDWVFIEEAARANGSELVGPLLLGNRRVMIGDHNQLSPFEFEMRSEFYGLKKARILLQDARMRLDDVHELDPAVVNTLRTLIGNDDLCVDVLATAVRLEQPFRSIAEREHERSAERLRESSFCTTLTEQSRMHPAICELVSNVFYSANLQSSDRVTNRSSPVKSKSGFPSSPIVVLNLPTLSKVAKPSYEERDITSLANSSEVEAIWSALSQLHPASGLAKLPTLAILSPYSGQVKRIEQRIRKTQQKDGLLCGFQSPRDDGRFVFTVDSFQGGEADVVFVSLVRNNTHVGPRAVGFLQNRQRMNVLLSRARHKLILATSLEFIIGAVDGTDPEQLGTGKIGFLRTFVREIERLTGTTWEYNQPGATIIDLDDAGRPI